MIFRCEYAHIISPLVFGLDLNEVISILNQICRVIKKWLHCNLRIWNIFGHWWDILAYIQKESLFSCLKRLLPVWIAFGQLIIHQRLFKMTLIKYLILCLKCLVFCTMESLSNHWRNTLTFFKMTLVEYSLR